MPFDHFNIIAGLYDRAGKYDPTELLLGLLALKPNSRLLDAGGGTGRVSVALRDMVGDVIVVDMSTGMLRRAAEKGLPSVLAPVEFLPLASGSVDRVIMVDALHHVKSQGQTIAALWRVLAPGGRIVIIEPDIHKMAVKLIAVIEKMLLMRSHIISGDAIASLFSDMEANVTVGYSEFNVLIVAEKSN
jgi:ubiquinone/menaquinone biosynthesis C-methylase UbiE